MTKPSRKKKFKRPPISDMVEIFKDGYWWFQWCCDCNLRHIWRFSIKRGRTPKEDIVIMTGTADRYATKMMRKLLK